MLLGASIIFTKKEGKKGFSKQEKKENVFKVCGTDTQLKERAHIEGLLNKSNM